MSDAAQSPNPHSQRWLEPLAGDAGPCGADLEYDNAYLALTQAAAGKPESQFAAAEPPDWRAVAEQCEALLDRSRDLRVALLWLRARVNLGGFAALAEGLQLVLGLLSQFWPTLHPLPDADDGDPYARVNALALLRENEGLIGDLRQAEVVKLRGVGGLRLRDLEIAWGQLTPRSDEQPMARDKITTMLADAARQDPTLPRLCLAALDAVKALTRLLNEQFGSEQAPDLRPLHQLVQLVVGAMPAVVEAAAAADAGPAADSAAAGADGPAGGNAAAGGNRLSGSIQSREEAVRAIDMVCDYLERSEPANPAPLLLRRARRMVNRSFLQLMKELAPDSLAAVAGLMGVDPESIDITGTE